MKYHLLFYNFLILLKVVKNYGKYKYGRYVRILNNELNTQIDWNILCSNYKLSIEIIEEFIEKHKNKVNWYYV